jgi:hypothetical protein
MTQPNPFSDFPVAKLEDDLDEATRNTIQTEAIRRVGGLVSDFIRQWGSPLPSGERHTTPLIAGVRGDYGSGKTHLLLYATRELERGLAVTYPDATFLRVKAVERDPVGWYSSEIGPSLSKLTSRTVPGSADAPIQSGLQTNRLRSLLVRVYARAAQQVASEAELMEGVSRRLNEEPLTVLRLVREGLLNETATEEAFRQNLLDLCPRASDAVRRAFAGLVWPETAEASLHWIAGDGLSDKERQLLRVRRPLSTDEDAFYVLTGIATLHATLGVPFGLMIDEAEQLIRHAARYAQRNVLWLKRLIEALAEQGSVVFVAGHDSAWRDAQDLLQRIVSSPEIDLRTLTGGQVLRLIVKGRVPNASVKALRSSAFTARGAAARQR